MSGHITRPILSGMYAIIIAVVVMLVLAGCSSEEAPPYNMASESELPAFLADDPPRVREAYQFAMANPHEMEKYPCYCGCGAMGHSSNLSCYVSEIAADGAVTFDNHAEGCGICVDITQDVMRLMREGQRPKDIRAYIDAQYSPFGPSTDTPLPLD